ncbi:KTSC domain-containing protein [Longimicrobium sp.]|uniref:KTSC domain-containing protein n=1 Tax=Longimicrobium sp. TaxID=2029185 RepID=UPI002E317543|nr:KTSC domain-containing protein [Longimicrobium sp.]HEX6040495.1 KTSC domain-containing protein [Longimicrobium sp.]
MVQRVPVESSNIAAVGYVPERRVLQIEFVGGRIYEYAGVPSTVHDGLMRAPSKGTFFARHIRPAGFAYRRVG